MVVFAFATAFAALLLAGASAEGAVYRVSQKGSPAADGSSWEKAMDTIAFYQKLRKAKSGDEFWVAAGTYYPYNFPSPTGDRELSFMLGRGVALYGGFKGNETKREQRDWHQNKTTLSGEIQGDGNPANNVYSVVVTSTDADHTSVLDGFVITGGYGRGSAKQTLGGGLRSYGKPRVANCIFEKNQAEAGGAITAWSPVLITDCIFRDNFAEREGGAVFALRTPATIVDCTFKDNRAREGGAVFYTQANNFLMKNCTFINNEAYEWSGGALCIVYSSGAVVNSTFYQNRAAFGGGGIGTFDSPAKIVNCTLYKNRAGHDDRGFDFFVGDGSGPEIKNCILWGDEPGRLYAGANIRVTHCVIKGGYPGGVFVIAGDPRLSAAWFNGGKTRTCAIGEGSSAIDNGDPYLAPKEDQRGLPRPKGRGVDIGAYEEQNPPAAPDPKPGFSASPPDGPKHGPPVQPKPSPSADPSVFKPKKPAPQKPGFQKPDAFGPAKPDHQGPGPDTPGEAKPPAFKPVKPIKPVKPVKPDSGPDGPSHPPVKKLPAVKPPLLKPPQVKGSAAEA